MWLERRCAVHVVKEVCASYLCGENCIWSEKVVYIACMRINIWDQRAFVRVRYYQILVWG